jgi:hypothetical protein
MKTVPLRRLRAWFTRAVTRYVPALPLILTPMTS